MEGWGPKARAPNWVFKGAAAKESTRRPLCELAEKHFGLHGNRICRYFAGWDDLYLVQWHGAYFRGFHVPYSARTTLPVDLLHCFFHPPDPFGEVEKFEDTIAFDNLVYIRHSICADPTAVVTTYAHELQHVVQRANSPRLLAANQVLYHGLKRFEPAAIATDIPSEREANIVSKRIAEIVCGTDAVRAMAETEIRLMRDAGENEQEARWIFFRDVPSSTEYSLLEATLSLVEKYKQKLDFEMDVNQSRWWEGPLNSPEFQS